LEESRNSLDCNRESVVKFDFGETQVAHGLSNSPAILENMEQIDDFGPKLTVHTLVEKRYQETNQVSNRSMHNMFPPALPPFEQSVQHLLPNFVGR
jgi:hypothetical protein